MLIINLFTSRRTNGTKGTPRTPTDECRSNGHQRPSPRFLNTDVEIVSPTSRGRHWYTGSLSFSKVVRSPSYMESYGTHTRKMWLYTRHLNRSWTETLNRRIIVIFNERRTEIRKQSLLWTNLKIVLGWILPRYKSGGVFCCDNLTTWNSIVTKIFLQPWNKDKVTTKRISYKIEVLR